MKNIVSNKFHLLRGAAARIIDEVAAGSEATVRSHLGTNGLCSDPVELDVIIVKGLSRSHANFLLRIWPGWAAVVRCPLSGKS